MGKLCREKVGLEIAGLRMALNRPPFPAGLVGGELPGRIFDGPREIRDAQVFCLVSDAEVEKDSRLVGGVLFGEIGGLKWVVVLAVW